MIIIIVTLLYSTYLFFFYILLKPANAEVKIVEKRRRSMIAINGSIQLSQNSNLARKRALDSKENGQFRMQMEDIKECSEGTETIEEEKRRENSNNNSIQRDEENRERVAELSLENVEEEIIGEEMNAGNHNLNENQNNGENRCDSGFGEPGGSMSNRSSLLSSNSVPLPVEANSTPPPQCGDNCDCGQPGCNGQGVMGNSEPSQDVSTGDNTVEQGNKCTFICYRESRAQLEFCDKYLAKGYFFSCIIQPRKAQLKEKLTFLCYYIF